MSTKFQNNDTIYSLKTDIDYIVGSGNHTNSHIIINGYLSQAHLPLYSRLYFRFSPGFEHGNNTRYNRKIGLECMTCHNSFPHFT